ncbi:MAG: DegQ family serine endoprotease [bacterium]
MKKLTKLQIVVVLMAGILIGGLAVSQLDWLPKTRAENTTPEVVNTPKPTYDTNVIRDLNNAFIDIAAKANKSVVTIFTDKVIKASQQTQNPFANDPFREFFGDDFFGRFFSPRLPQGDRHLRGMGSGVIVSADGYILTNNHVVQDADKVQVMLFGGKKIDAKVIGADAKTDIAVIKVDGDHLTPMELGDSDQLHTGEWVMAIGSPLSENLAHTVTAGIVSAKGRSNVGLADYEDFIQTDAAINPGNSGGALLNLDGKLVGINAAIATQSGGFQGIGFAVPINMARMVMDALIKHGKVVRGWLGVYIQNVDESMAHAMGLTANKGALISDVVKDGPAAKAGVKVGDVILKLDGKPVKNSTQLRNHIARLAPGTEVSLTVNRDGKEKTIAVTLGELPEKTPAPEVRKTMVDKLGFSVQALDNQLANQFGLDPNDRGVVITQINRGSQAFAAGLRQGDLIKEVNRRRVATVREFSDIVSKVKSGDTILIYAKRQSNRFFVAFEVK